MIFFFLTGVPIISGRANISYHAHFGSVTFFLNLQHKVLTTEVQQHSSSGLNDNSSMIREESEKDLELEDEVEPETLMKKKFSDSSLPPVKILENDAVKIASQTLPGNTKLRHRNSSPIMRRRPQINNPNVNNMARRSSKTLPRGFSLANAAAGDSLDCDVFGLYGELLNVRDYDCDSGERIAMNDELRKSDPELSTIPYRYVFKIYHIILNLKK